LTTFSPTIEWTLDRAERLRSELGTLMQISESDADRAAAAKDFSWVSPLISERIPRTLPDVVVRPVDVAGVRALARWAFREGVALTLRGRGTSNYGQTIPLARGVVADLTGMTGEIQIDAPQGMVRAPAGTRFDDLIDSLDGTGWELASYPTTLNSTVAGWVGGGSGGVGGLIHGLNHEGVVRELVIVPVDAIAEPVVVAWPDTTPHVHAYGTTGIIVAVGLRIVPARSWTSLFASVADLDTGAALALDVLRGGILPRILAVTEPELAALFPDDPGLEPGATNVRMLVDVEDVDRVGALVRSRGGAVTSLRPDANRFLATLINNHTTLRAKAARPDLFHVLVRGEAIAGRRALIGETFPGAHLQLEGGRFDGELTLSGRILAPFVSTEAIDRGMARLRAEGIEVDNPHTWVVHTALEPRWVQSRRFDPAGLLNPGKLSPLAAPAA
jgi:FAD/FMN-containing dehydrogenase